MLALKSSPVFGACVSPSIHPAEKPAINKTYIPQMSRKNRYFSFSGICAYLYHITFIKNITLIMNRNTIS